MIFGIKICHKMPKSLTIQKLDCCDRLSVTSFVAALKSNAFDGSNYKRWCDRMILWLTAMNIIHVANGKPEQFTPEEEQAFMVADNLFRGAVINVLAENLVDFYLTATSNKELWDALETKYGVSGAGSELYVIEQFCDYKMVDDRSIVEQAHEIQSLAKELECFRCVLPDKFVAGGILPLLWNIREKSSASLILLALWMLKRRRVQKTLVEKELLGLLVPMWYRRIILINLTRRRRTSRRTPQRLNRQLILRRTTREIALSVTILVISTMNVRTASGRAIKISKYGYWWNCRNIETW
jgi:hypothetical protein